MAAFSLKTFRLFFFEFFQDKSKPRATIPNTNRAAKKSTCDISISFTRLDDFSECVFFSLRNKLLLRCSMVEMKWKATF